MSNSERPTVPAPPIPTKELAEEWERRLAESKKENGK